MVGDVINGDNSQLINRNRLTSTLEVYMPLENSQDKEIRDVPVLLGFGFKRNEFMRAVTDHQITSSHEYAPVHYLRKKSS